MFIGTGLSNYPRKHPNKNYVQAFNMKRKSLMSPCKIYNKHSEQMNYEVTGTN